jgi:hypothetical protein
MSYKRENNNIGDIGIEMICQTLTKLVLLNASFNLNYLASNDIGDDGALAIAYNLTQLNHLYISANHIGIVGLTAVANRLNLLTLCICTNNNHFSQQSNWR